MSNSNGLITLPINIKADLGYVLGTGSGDLGYNIVNGNINKWARFKPVRRTGVDYSSEMNAARTAWKDDSTWWKGIDGHCGLTVAEYTDLGEPFSASSDVFLKKLRLEQLPWNYLRPRGLANNEWFRAFDFMTYFHGAQPPIADIGATDIWLDNAWGGQIDWDTLEAGPYELELSDFLIGQQDMTNYYLGILLWRSSGYYYFLTSETKFTEGGSISIPFTASQAMVGSWNMVPFISSVQYSLGSEAQAGRYASLFGLPNTEITLHAPGTIVSFVVFAEWNTAFNGIAYTVYITNNDRSTSRTLTDVTVEIRTTTSESQQPSTGDLVVHQDLGTITVGANSTVSRTGTFTVSKNSNLISWAHGYADDYYGSGYQQIEEPEPPEENS